jgi:hypothetical protein
LENTSTLLLTACVCWTVYRAVAWQCFDQIRCNIKANEDYETEEETRAQQKAVEPLMNE